MPERAKGPSDKDRRVVAKDTDCLCWSKVAFNGRVLRKIGAHGASAPKLLKIMATIYAKRPLSQINSSTQPT